MRMLPRKVSWFTIAVLVFGAVQVRLMAQDNRNCANNYVSGLTALADLGTGTYMGSQGGLYPGGANVRPAAHEADGVGLATQKVLPRNASGAVDLVNGKIGFVYLGHSQGRIISQGFDAKCAANAGLINPKLVRVNAMQNGKGAAVWANPNDGVWTTVASRIASAGLTGSQVQVAYCMFTDNISVVGSNFPQNMQTMKASVKQALLNLKAKYPKVRLAYLLTIPYEGYTAVSNQDMNEPHGYRSGFSQKWIIEDQINGVPGLGYKAESSPAPWLSWGAYMWSNGLGSDHALGGIMGRNLPTPLEWECDDYRQLDGMHLSEPAYPGFIPGKGQDKAGVLMWDFFSTDTTTRPWFMKP